MKILHVVPTYLPATRYGGPIQSVHGLARAQADLGHEVEVVTTSVDGQSDSAVELNVPISLEGVTVWYYRSPFLRRLYWSPTMRSKLNQSVGSYNLVHLHSVFLWPTNYAARTAKKKNVPFVLSPRGMLERPLIRQRSRLAKTLWISLFERWTVEHAAAVHFTSRREETACRELGFSIKASFVCPNGFDPVDLPQEAKPVPGAPYALYLGRISWKKGLDRLIPALARVPNVSLVLAGNDDENLTPQLERLAQECGIGNRVTFPGYVGGPEKWTLLRHALCLVLPSRSENFGNVALEAVAAGCPVVLTHEVGVSEYLQDASLVTEGCPEALAAAIDRLENDRDLRHRLQSVGQQILQTEFSWRSVAERMIATYESLAER